MVDAAKRATEDREAALREQVGLQDLSFKNHNWISCWEVKMS